ncbi:MAG: GMC family oxidoreductase [Solirubrobacterales bacterium]
MFDPLPKGADVVIVGMGAAGGLAAAQLALAGVEVVGIDAGERYGPEQFTVDELANDRREWLTKGKTFDELPTVRETADQVAARPGFATVMMNAIGGTKIHAAAGSVRLLPWNFRSRSETIARYGAGALPAGSTVEDWPFDYEELAPFYDKVERLLGCSGKAGNIEGEIQAGGNPFEGPRSREYPMPPLRRTGYSELMADAARGLGWHPYPHPAAVNSVPYGGRAACTYCGNCTHNGCWADAKGLVSVAGLPEAERSGNLRVVTAARVTEVLVDGDGRATGVAYVKDGRRHVQRAAVVLIAGYVYENARLLLLSRSPAHPDGLANGSGQVGRHFSTHALRMTYGEFAGRELNTWNGSTEQATAVDDFNADNFDHAEVGFIGGGRLCSLSEKKLLTLARRPPAEVGRWGADFKRWMAAGMRSVGIVSRLVDELSHEDAYLDLDPTHTDPMGFPVVRVTRAWLDNDVRQADFLGDRVQEWFEAAGATRIWHAPGKIHNVSGHAYGGTRMGDDPAKNVVDRWGFAHEVPNLGILGASTFPTSSGHAPVATIEATAWRTADHLVGAWSSIAG